MRQRGFPVDDPAGFYLLTLRMLVVWPFDADGFITGEQTYSAITTPDFFKKLEASEVPQSSANSSTRASRSVGRPG